MEGKPPNRPADEVKKEKRRSTLWGAEGGTVLRFTATVLRDELDNALGMVHDTINRYGGLADPGADGGFRYTKGPDDPQPRLF